MRTSPALRWILPGLLSVLLRLGLRLGIATLVLIALGHMLLGQEPVLKLVSHDPPPLAAQSAVKVDYQVLAGLTEAVMSGQLAPASAAEIWSQRPPIDGWLDVEGAQERPASHANPMDRLTRQTLFEDAFQPTAPLRQALDGGAYVFLLATAAAVMVALTSAVLAWVCEQFDLWRQGAPSHVRHAILLLSTTLVALPVLRPEAWYRPQIGPQSFVMELVFTAAFAGLWARGVLLGAEHRPTGQSFLVAVRGARAPWLAARAASIEVLSSLRAACPALVGAAMFARVKRGVVEGAGGEDASVTSAIGELISATLSASDWVTRERAGLLLLAAIALTVLTLRRLIADLEWAIRVTTDESDR